MDAISALKRLERAGAEDSRATRKLCQAAEISGAHCIGLLDSTTVDAVVLRDRPGYVYPWPQESLPRGYAVAASGALVLFQEDEGWFSVAASRSMALRFAADIATGWLDELAEWLEARRVEADSAAEALSAAAQ